MSTVTDKIAKLIAVANDSATTPEAAASYMAKAIELIEAHNIDMAAVEAAANGTNHNLDRVQEEFPVSHYSHDQDIWRYVGYMNFCAVSIYFKNETVRKPSKNNKTIIRSVNRKMPYLRIIGRQVNVISAKIMSEYLIGALKRMVEAKYTGKATDPDGKFGEAAYSYRVGFVNSVCQRLWAKRTESEANTRTTETANTKNAVTLGNYADLEEKGNYEFVYGPGSWDRLQLRILEAEEIKRVKAEEDARYLDELKAKSPAKWQKEVAKREREARKGIKYIKVKDYDAFYSGKADGSDISLSRQVSTTETLKIGG